MKIRKNVRKVRKRKIMVRRWMECGYRCKIGQHVLWHVVEVHRHYIEYVIHQRMEVKNVKEMEYRLDHVILIHVQQMMEGKEMVKIIVIN